MPNFSILLNYTNTISRRYWIITLLSMSRQPARRTISAQARAILGHHPPSRHTGFPLSALSDVSTTRNIDVPEYLDSLQFLQHAGFDTAPAQQIWQTRVSDTSGRNPSLFECACQFAAERATERDAWLPSHDWDRALRNMGIRADHGRNVTSPEYKLARGSISASHSVLDWIETVYIFLEGLSTIIVRKAHNRSIMGDQRMNV